MNQDVAWARATAGIMTKIFKGKLKWDVVGHETFPTGASDFAPALMKAKMKGAQVIMPVFRHAPERHPDQAVEGHEGPGGHGRVHQPPDRPHRLEDL